jgi:hypothetical protein
MICDKAEKAFAVAQFSSLIAHDTAEVSHEDLIRTLPPHFAYDAV